MSTVLYQLRSERIRWAGPRGSTAVWLADGHLVVRRGPAGKYRDLGLCSTPALALALLPGGVDAWRRLGKGPTELATKGRRPAPPPVTDGELRGTREVNGVAVAGGDTNGTPAMRLARAAAYRLRLMRTGRLQLESPPGAAEIAAALLDPACMLDAREIALALAELGMGGGIA